MKGFDVIMIEILAPAGSPESLKAALNTGADAVYLGLQNFSARRNAKNFTEQDLYEAAKLCRLSGVKMYVAINTLLFDDEIEEANAAVGIAIKAGADAVIVQDLALIELAKEAGIPIHASTQMTITSASGARAAKNLGFSRVVLARELNLNEIKEIVKESIETEVFVHGALCASVSGQCLMSSFMGDGGRSANRGLCAQPCRLNYKAGGSEYALSLKDLSIIEHIKQLEEAGVTSVKIEGRMKRPEYVAAAVDACYKAGQGLKPDMQRLEAVFSRGGFTSGYFTGERKKMRGHRGREDAQAAENVLKELRGLYRTPFKRRKLDIRLVVGADGIIAECGDITLSFPPPELVKTRETTAADCIAGLSKLGGTIFETGEITCDIQNGLYLPAAKINKIRREVVNAVTERLTSKCGVQR